MLSSLVLVLEIQNEKADFLPNGIKCGEIVKDMVMSLGYQVKTITDVNEELTGDEKDAEEYIPVSYETFEKQLNDWFMDVVPGDKLFVYYTGHGSLLRYKKGEIKPAEGCQQTIDNPHNALSPGHYEAQTPEGARVDCIDARDMPTLYLGQGNYYKGLHKVLDALDRRVSGVTVIGVMDCCHSEKMMELKYTMQDYQSRRSEMQIWRDSKTRTRRNDRNVFLSVAACRKKQWGIDWIYLVEGLNRLGHDSRPNMNFYKQMCQLGTEELKNAARDGNRRRNLTVTCSNDKLDVDSFNFFTLMTENLFEQDGSLKKDYTLGTSKKIMGRYDFYHTLGSKLSISRYDKM